MKTKELKTKLTTAHNAIDVIEAMLRKEHEFLSSLEDISNHRATEKVTVAGLLEQASRAQRELTKMRHTLNWYAEYRYKEEGED